MTFCRGYLAQFTKLREQTWWAHGRIAALATRG